MAVVDATASRVIADVRRRGVFGPAAASSYPTDSDILDFLNDEIDSYMVPLLQGLGEEYFVAISTGTTESGTDEYRLPARAMWNDIRDVQISYQNQWWSLSRLEPEMTAKGSAVAQGTPQAYYVQRNSVVFYPTPNASLSYRFKYFQRPGRLVTTGYSTPTGLSGSSSPYTATVASTSGFGTLLDVIQSDSPFDTLETDIAAATQNATTTRLTLTATQAATFTADYLNASYLCNVGESPVVQLPAEMIPLLTLRAVAAILLAQNNPRAGSQFEAAEQLAREFKRRVSERTKGLPRKVIGFRRWSAPSW